MHFTTLLLPLLASVQVSLAQAGAYGASPAAADTTAMTTWTKTMTVERVVQTVTSTRNGTEIPVTTTSYGLGSGVPTGYGNATGVYPTGSYSVGTATSSPIAATGAAAALGVSGLGFVAAMALVGVVGL